MVAKKCEMIYLLDEWIESGENRLERWCLQTKDL